MTADELTLKMRMGFREEMIDLKKVLEEARAALPVLLDCGRQHSAERLREALFQYDAHQQERVNWTNANAQELVASLMRSLEGKP